MKQSQWSSRLGYILAAAGSAVGLGAIWKFPYVTAANGGGAFLLVFLLFSFTLGVAVADGGDSARQPDPARGGGGLR